MHYMLWRTEKSSSHKQTVAIEYKCSWTLVGSPQCYIHQGCYCLNVTSATANERPDDMSMLRSTCWQTVGSASEMFEKPPSPPVTQRLLWKQTWRREKQTQWRHERGTAKGAKAKGANRTAEAAVKLIRQGDGCTGQRSNQTQHARKYRPRFSPGTLRNTRRAAVVDPIHISTTTSSVLLKIVDCVATEDAAAAGVWCEQSIKGAVYYCGVLPQTSGCQLDCQIRLRRRHKALPWQLRSSNSTGLPALSIFQRHRLQIPVVFLALPRQIWEWWQGLFGWVTSAI